MFFLALVSASFAQLPGVSRNGSVKAGGEVFVNRNGERVAYPRLNHYGEILRYAPLVAMDSVRLSDTAVTSAFFYGKVAFNGWSPVLSCGFDCATTEDFSEYRRMECAVDVGEKIAGFSELSYNRRYYVRSFATNEYGTSFSDIVQVHIPLDLFVSIESDKASSVSLCTGGTRVTYHAVLTGSNRNKPFFDFQWSASTGNTASHDTVFSVLYNEAGTYEVSVKAFYGEDTIVASLEQFILPRSGAASFYVCTNEFLNTAEATTTGVTSIRWLDGDRNTVATTNSVKLPTGHYTVECSDGVGCVLSKEVYVGKKPLSCVVHDAPGGHESTRFEDGVWKIDSISDVDGYWYAVTQIGEKCWLRQNLRTRHMPSTHADLLATGSSYTPNMMYVSGPNASTTIYDPELTPFYGACYNWCAALDVSTYYDSDFQYNFAKQRQGVCPDGWHIPTKDEALEMVRIMLDSCCAGETYYPDLSVDNQYAAQNTPISIMMLRSCYDSYSSPVYPKEIYDASNMSLPTELQSKKFWLADFREARNAGYVFSVRTNKEGVSFGIGIRNGEHLAVRCVRDYPEE